MEYDGSRKNEFIAMLEGMTGQEIANTVNKLNSLMAYYRCAILETETKFKVLDQQFSLSHERNPITAIESRIKSIPSIQEKLLRDGVTPSVDNIEKHLNDVAGVRVICAFIDDIYMLADCLISQDDITLIKRKDYIKEPKENGYRSLHLVIEIPIFLYNEKRKVKVEVQLRTIAMESWANLEHRLRYKKELDRETLDRTSDILNECAVLSGLLDEKMQLARDIIDGTENKK